MGKNKLKKFRDMETIDFVYQYPFFVLKEKGFPHRGHWAEVFGNHNPIVLELGCGKGEYTVGMARRRPDCNFIGIDIKGARMWTGAMQAREEGLTNVAFVRTSIELLPHFFAPGEVDAIWITFPDPQMKKVNKRLVSKRFLELYRQVTADGATINLKTDSPFLYAYTRRFLDHNTITPIAATENLYESHLCDDVLSIRTFYEQQWLTRGLTIKYVAFPLDKTTVLDEPVADDIPLDTYRSFSRGTLEQSSIK